MNEKAPQPNKKSFSENWKKLGDWLEPVRVIFDITVIIVMILALSSSNDAVKATMDANELSSQALRSTYIPWLKLVHFSIDSMPNNLVNFNFRFKNFSSNGPATNLRVRSVIPKILIEQASYIRDALMPGEEGAHELTIPRRENLQTINAIQAGQLPIRLSITFTDIFGTPYTIEEEFRKIGRQYRHVDYLPKLTGINPDPIKK